MVIDTSAVLAILFREPDGRRYAECMESDKVKLISAVSRVELSLVVEGRKGAAGRLHLEAFLRALDADVVAATADHAEIAIEAFRKFGKGRHPAGLNIGDCFSYALAAATGQPLLFRGDDFARTDIRSALPDA
jgi:ribonuclease VapC